MVARTLSGHARRRRGARRLLANHRAPSRRRCCRRWPASRCAPARGRAGAGSASVITRDGYLLTSAHVVAGATTAEATFTDGTDVDRRRRGPGHRCRTWPSSSRAATRRRRSSRATPRPCASASSSSPSATRSAWPAASRRASCPPSAARCPRRPAASSTRSSRPTPRSTPATAGESSPTITAGWSGVNTAVAGIGLGPRRPHQHDHARDRHDPDDHGPGSAGLARHRRQDDHAAPQGRREGRLADGYAGGHGRRRQPRRAGRHPRRRHHGGARRHHRSSRRRRSRSSWSRTRSTAASRSPSGGAAPWST